jgi:hypothetical protein
MNKGPICGRFMKKTRGQKSRATVPLTNFACPINLAGVSLTIDTNFLNADLLCIYESRVRNAP